MYFGNKNNVINVAENRFHIENIGIIQDLVSLETSSTNQDTVSLFLVLFFNIFTSNINVHVLQLSYTCTMYAVIEVH